MEWDVVGKLPMRFPFLGTYEASADWTSSRHFLVEPAELNTSSFVEIKIHWVHPLQNLQGILQDDFWLQFALYQSC